MMTNDCRGDAQHGLDDERCVDALLAEAGFEDDTELREVLLQLRSLRTATVPPPSAELAALMQQPQVPGVASLQDRRSRHRGRKSAALTSLAVAASLGAAGSAAAGNEVLVQGAAATVSTIVQALSPAAPSAPTKSPAAPTQDPAVAPLPAKVPPAPSPATSAPVEGSPGKVPEQQAAEPMEAANVHHSGEAAGPESGAGNLSGLPDTTGKQPGALDSGPAVARPTAAPQEADAQQAAPHNAPPQDAGRQETGQQAAGRPDPADGKARGKAEPGRTKQAAPPPGNPQPHP